MYQNFDLSSQSLRTLFSIFQTFLFVSPMTIGNVWMCIHSHYTPNFNQSVILIFMMYTIFFWNKTTTTAVFHVLFLLITLRKCMCMYSSSCYIGMVHVCISACKINLMQLLLWTPEAIHRCCLPYFFLYSMQEYGCSNQLMYTFNI